MKKLLSLFLILFLSTSNVFSASLELDYMEYSSDANAQAAYVTNATYVSQYPTLDTSHVKATTVIADYYPHNTCNPALSVTGSIDAVKAWTTTVDSVTNQRFHIDLGAAYVIKRIYYENGHHSGTNTDAGARGVSFWGSNSATSFAELTYTTDTGWTQLPLSGSEFYQHVAADQADPKYLTVTNETAYQYYAFKFANNWGDLELIQLRRIELQRLALQSYSESTIKTQGSYALKAVAAQTDSLNKTLTKTFSTNHNLTGVKNLRFDAYALRTGGQWKLGLHDTGGTTTEYTPNIITSNTWQPVNWDLSGVSDANKDSIDQLILTITNADSSNTVYLDYFEIAQTIDTFGWIN